MARLRKVDAGLDRQIVTGMIVSTPYLKAVKDIYKPAFMLDPFTVIVAGWCLDYLEQYDVAPGKHIQDIFKLHERDGMIESYVDIIEQFLSSLSEEYARAEKFNVDYLLDQTEKVFQSRALKGLTEDIDALLSRGELLEAQSEVSRYRIPQRMMVIGSGFTEEEEILAAFESREEPLFKLPGAIGHLMNPHFIRGGFMGMLGREKIGKTWLMHEMKLSALKAKCNVAMFQLGDLTKNDYRIRQGVRIAGKSNDVRYCDELEIPMLDCYYNQIAECPVESNRYKNNEAIRDRSGDKVDEAWNYALEHDSHEPCTKCYRKNFLRFKGMVWRKIRPPVEPLNGSEAVQAIKRYEKRQKLGRFKLAVHPNSTVNVRDMERQLDIWEDHDGFVPDVILVDYADIMAPEDARKDDRGQENDRWKALRRVSQERHTFLCTVTQGNRLGYNVGTMQGEHVSEDKRKLSHVTAFFSLNQTDEEKDEGILRVAPIREGIREGHSSVNQQVCIIQCLQIGQPIVSSFYNHNPKKAIKKEEDKKDD